MKRGRQALVTFLATVLTMTGLLGLATPVAAVSSASLDVQPPSETLTAKAGQTITHTITVKNTQTSTQSITVHYNDFDQTSQDSGSPKLEDAGQNADYGLGKWMSGASTLSLGASQSKEYTLTLKVPVSATARTYYGAVTFSPAASGGTQGAAVGSLVFVTVGGATASGQPGEFSGQFAGSKTTFSLQVQNTSEALFTPVPTVNLTIAGKPVTLKPDSDGSVLPKASRIYTFTSTDAIEAGKTYNATATITLPDGTKLTKTTSVIVPSADSSATGTPGKKAAADNVKKTSDQILLIGLGVIGLLVIGLVIYLVVRTRRPAPTAPTPPVADTLNTAPSTSPTDPVTPASDLPSQPPVDKPLEPPAEQPPSLPGNDQPPHLG